MIMIIDHMIMIIVDSESLILDSESRTSRLPRPAAYSYSPESASHACAKCLSVNAHARECKCASARAARTP